MFRKTIFIALAAIAVLACKKEMSLPTIPEDCAVTGEYTSLTAYTVFLNGHTHTTSMMREVERGMLLSTNPNPTKNNSEIYRFGDLSSPDYSCYVRDLEPATTYYYRAFTFWREIGGGYKEGYGEIKSFTTPTNTITVTTETPIIGTTMIQMHGTLYIEYDNFSSSISPRFIFGKTQEEVESGSGEILSPMWDLNSRTSFHDVKYFVGSDKYYFRAFVIIDGEYFYGEIKSFSPAPFEPTEGSVVDMGLSLKWGSCNVGANTPEEYGDYFAWGETTPKENYSSDNYTYPSLVSGTLPLSADAASANLGSGWRMPSWQECEELINNSLAEWGKYNSVVGYRFISKKNGNSIFFPAAGWMEGTSIVSAGTYGKYWNTNIILEFEDHNVGYLYFPFRSACIDYTYSGDPFLGYSVRGVYEL